MIEEVAGYPIVTYATEEQKAQSQRMSVPYSRGDEISGHSPFYHQAIKSIFAGWSQTIKSQWLSTKRLSL